MGGIMKRRTISFVLAAVFTVGVVATAGPAFASGPNGGWTWQENFGTRVFGKVQIQGSYNDNCRSAVRGYQRFTRQSGPSLDTGRLYTQPSSSQYDSRYWNRTDYVWDSPLSGSQYNTNYSYGFDWRSILCA